jgi:hypothetical protein
LDGVGGVGEAQLGHAVGQGLPGQAAVGLGGVAAAFGDRGVHGDRSALDCLAQFCG